jgi:quercetin 2,3-dioxygenase
VAEVDPSLQRAVELDYVPSKRVFSAAPAVHRSRAIRSNWCHRPLILIEFRLAGRFESGQRSHNCIGTDAAARRSQMMVVRRAKERSHQRGRKQERWVTFDAVAQTDQLAHGFSSLQLLNESRLPAGGGNPTHPERDAEIITYVLEGSLAYDDSLGRSGVLHAGEFRRMTAGRGARFTETNASKTDLAHFFQLWLRSPAPHAPPTHEQKRFSAAERRGRLCLVASSDARMSSLHLREDALVYSALLERGHHIVYDLALGRAAWIHVVAGQITLGDAALFAGDGAGISGERPVSFTAREETEILLLDLLERPAEASHVP